MVTMGSILGLNNIIPFKVLTNKGVLDINEINVGDKVYEYQSGDLLEVKGIKKLDRDVIYKVTYNDKRESYHRSSDLMLVNTALFYMDDLLKHDYLKFEFNEYPIEFKESTYNPLYPDPYTAGAFLIHGNFEYRYINIPNECITDSLNDLLMHKYHVVPVIPNLVPTGNIFYSWRNDPPNHEFITWEEFFKKPNHDFSGRSKGSKLSWIPEEYMMSSINNRQKFIRGVFDAGFSMSSFNDTIGVSNEFEFRLEEVQKMLWSLGISSVITYDPFIRRPHKMQHRLDIVTERYFKYPGFFYDIDDIEEIINRNNTIDYAGYDKIHITSIKRYTTGYMSNLILEKPRCIYLQDNFLPRVSI